MNTAHLELRREAPAHGGILGELWLNGTRLCHTLERVGVAIPAGPYQVLLSVSPKFKMLMPLLVGAHVPASWGVRLHPGTRPAHSDGCVLLGQARMPGQARIYKQVEAFEQLMSQLVGYDVISLLIR